MDDGRVFGEYRERRVREGVWWRGQKAIDDAWREGGAKCVNAILGILCVS